jgi:hypothetical protein
MFNEQIYFHDKDGWIALMDTANAWSERDLEDARQAYFIEGGIESDIGARSNPSWYWRRAVKHLQLQRDSLQRHGSKLAMRNQRLRMKELALEEIHRENARLTERIVMLERVAEKLHDECGSEVLSEEECYVLEAIGNHRKGTRE